MFRPSDHELYRRVADRERCPSFFKFRVCFMTILLCGSWGPDPPGMRRHSRAVAPEPSISRRPLRACRASGTVFLAALVGEARRGFPRSRSSRAPATINEHALASRGACSPARGPLSDSQVWCIGKVTVRSAGRVGWGRPCGGGYSNLPTIVDRFLRRPRNVVAA